MSDLHTLKPRSLMPADDEAGSSQQKQISELSTTTNRTRKRRPPAHVSQNACTNCKRARAKCDGAEGKSCSRCISKGLANSCQYELHAKTAKEELVRRVERLQIINMQRLHELNERNAWIRTVTDFFSPGSPGQTVLARLQSEEDGYDKLIEILGSAPPSNPIRSSSPRFSDTDEGMSSEDETTFRWTNVMRDPAEIHHLMVLYFTWVHPFHMFFSQRHFMHSFYQQDPAYCSSALVNAIAAMGCRYCGDEDGSPLAIRRLRDRFARQVWADLLKEERLTAVSAVAYAIMFLVEVSDGNGREAISHLRLATETIKNRKKDPGADGTPWTSEALEITFSGINALNVQWMGLTYHKLSTSLPQDGHVFKHVDPDPPDSTWQNYKHPQDAQSPTVPSRALETAKQVARMTMFLVDTITAWCGSQAPVTAKSVIDLSRKYKAWKTELPSHLDISDITIEDARPETCLPCVLQMHMQYHTAVYQLLNPLLYCDDLSRDDMMTVQSVVLQSAQEGLRLHEIYRKLYSSRYQSPLQGFSLVHFADVVMRYNKQDAEPIIRSCLQNLGEALAGFPVTGTLQAMFCESVVSQDLPLPRDTQILMGGRTWGSYSREDRLGCLERLTYVQPVELLSEAVAPSFPREFRQEWDNFVAETGSPAFPTRTPPNRSDPGARTGSRSMTISSMINP